MRECHHVWLVLDSWPVSRIKDNTVDKMKREDNLDMAKVSGIPTALEIPNGLI